jgi:hypothetical protein
LVKLPQKEKEKWLKMLQECVGIAAEIRTVSYETPEMTSMSEHWKSNTIVTLVFAVICRLAIFSKGPVSNPSMT